MYLYFLNGLTKTNAVLEILILMIVAAILGGIIGYLLRRPKNTVQTGESEARIAQLTGANEDLKAKDGFTKLYIDGKLIEERQGLQWRAEGKRDTLISQFLFSTFHGGSTDKWTPRDKDGKWAEVHALFDNIAVYPGERVRSKPGK